MIPVTYNSSLKFCILVPSFDPLFEYTADAASARPNGRTRFSDDRPGREDGADPRTAQCGRPGERRAPRGAGSDIKR